MPDPEFEGTRKAKQSIRRKSRKSTTSRRKSRQQSRRQSRRLSRRQTGIHKFSKVRGNSDDIPPSTWDEEELPFGSLIANLQGEPLGESPIDLEVSTLKKATILPTLQWLNTENQPRALKIANTGFTATVSGLWEAEDCPKLRGGPLKEDYDFSQIHFHWGEDERDGSEHLINHNHYPLEVHVVFHKNSCGIHERARKETDGLIVVVYFYTLSRRPNINLEPLIANVNDILYPLTEKFVEPFKYSSVFPVFTEDYILYNGWMKSKCQHATLWFICRDTLGISADQLQRFRNMVGAEGSQIIKNYRDVKETGDIKVFIVYPSPVDTSKVLHPRPMTPEETEENKKKKSKKTAVDSRQSRKSSVRRKSKRQSRVGSKRQSMKRKSKAGSSRKSLKR